MLLPKDPFGWMVLGLLCVCASPFTTGNDVMINTTAASIPLEYEDLDEPAERKFEGPINDVEIQPLSGPVGLVNLTTPMFSIPFEDYQIQIYGPVGATPRPVFYYLPALTLLPNATAVVLNNLTGAHCTSITVKMWDQRFLRHIQSFLLKQAGIRKSSILPVPFKWMRFDYAPTEHLHLERSTSQWRPLGNYPQTVSMCLRCATSNLCHQAKQSIIADPGRLVSGVLVDFAYKLPSSREMPLCTGGPILSKSQTFSNIRNEFPGEIFVFLHGSDYHSLLKEFVGGNLQGRIFMHGFVADDEVDQAIVALHPLLYHNVTYAKHFTERTGNLTYRRDESTGPYAVSESTNQTDKLYCLNITNLIAHPPTCTIPVRVSGRNPDYNADLHVVHKASVDNSPDAEEDACREVSNATRGLVQRIDAFEVSVKSVAPVTCPSTCPGPESGMARQCSGNSKTVAHWVMRKADTMWAINNATVSALLLDENGDAFDQLIATSNGFGEISFPLSRKSGYDIRFDVIGYYPIMLRNFRRQFNLNHDSYMEPLLFINRQFTGVGTVFGTGIEKDSKPAPRSEYAIGAKLEFRSGLNSYTGSVVDTVLVGQFGRGNWKVSLQTGHYTVTASKAGFVTTSFHVVALGGRENSRDFTLLEPVSMEGVRITLRGGGRVHQQLLELHVTGPLEGSDQRFHVHWSTESEDGHAHNEHNTWMAATTLIKKQLPGVYRVTVHDHKGASYGHQDLHNKEDPNTWTLASTNAMVHLYRDGQFWAQYPVPNRKGNVWSVVEIDGMNLTPLNEMKGAVNDSEVNKLV